MKVLLIAFIFLFASTICSSQIKKIQDFSGRWDLTGEEIGASLEIIDSANIYLTYLGERKKIISYTIDFSKTPYWFDFKIPDSSSVVEIKSIVQVFSDNTMKWQVFIEEERVPHFTASSGEIMYLKKSNVGAAVMAKTQ